MKDLFKNIKSLVLGLALTCATAFGQGAYYSTNNLTAGAHTLVAVPATAFSLTLFSTNTAPTIVYLFDGAVTNVIGAYTNVVQYVTNQVTTYITTTGLTNTFTNRVLYTDYQAMTASTNAANPLVSLVIPPTGEIITYPLSPNLVFARSIILSNALTGASVVLNYRRN